MHVRSSTGIAANVYQCFVGRQAELDQVAGWLTSHGTRVRGGAVIVRGPAGIGKTEILRRSGRALETLSWHVVYVASDEIDRRVPYAAISRAISTTELAAPALRELRDDAVTALSLVDREAVSSIHAAAGRFFASLRDDRATLLVLDDLHLLDDDSAVLVASLLRGVADRPLVLLASMRHPDIEQRPVLTQLLDRFERDGRTRTLDLQPLDEGDVETLVSEMLRRSPDDALVTVVRRQSDGNPFFAVQTLLNLVESDAVVADDQSCWLSSPDPPFSVDRRRSFLNRVLDIGGDTRAVGRAVALLGWVAAGRVDLVASIAGMDLDEASDAIDLLVDRGILYARDDGTLGFSHQLIRDALYQEIGPVERWRTHRAAAVWLASLPSSPSVDVEVARHVRECAEPADELAIEALSRAAERVCMSAPHSSIEWYRAAVSVTPDGDARHGELMARLARALFLAGQPRDAADVGRASLVRIAPGDARQRLTNLVIEALIEISASQEASELIDLGIGSGLRYTAQSAHILALIGRLDDARRAAEQVLHELDQGTTTDQVISLVHLAHMRCVESNYGALPPILDRLSAVAAGAPAPAQLSAHMALGYILAWIGEPARSGESIARTQELLAASRWTLFQAEVAVAQVMNATNVGDWDAALSIIGASAAQLEETGSLLHLTVLRDYETEIHAHRGNWAAARRAADRPISTHPPWAALQVWARAGMDLASGDLEAARARLVEFLQQSHISGSGRSLLLTRLADVELDAGRPEVASHVLQDVAPLGSAELDHPTLVAARLAHGRATADVAVLAEARDLADLRGLVPLGAKARLFLGSFDEDPERHLTDALRTFQRLGAAPWRRRAVAELRRRGLSIPRHRAPSPTLLTDTEAQIARLVHQGRPNRDIAVAVSLSVKTVEAYLSRIYLKTVCSNRLELARAIDQGLLDVDRATDPTSPTGGSRDQ